VFDPNDAIHRDPLEVAVENAIQKKKDKKAGLLGDDDSPVDSEEDEEAEQDAEEMPEEPKNLKPAEGVKFVQFDQYGLPNDGFDYSKFISTDEALPTDAVINVAPEQLALQLAGHHKDFDKDPEKMNADGKGC